MRLKLQNFIPENFSMSLVCYTGNITETLSNNITVTLYKSNISHFNKSNLSYNITQKKVTKLYVLLFTEKGILLK